jgi:hypothetical protein
VASSFEWDRERLADHRHRARGFALRRNQRVDEALADSFPASDPAPWTLGVSDETGRGSDPEAVVRVKRARAGRPTWLQGLAALAEGSVAAIGFIIAVLIIGSVLALGVRLVVETLTAIGGWLFAAAPV